MLISGVKSLLVKYWILFCCSMFFVISFSGKVSYPITIIPGGEFIGKIPHVIMDELDQASHHFKTMPDALQWPAVCTVNEMKLTFITFLWTYLMSTSCHLLRWLSTRSSTLSSSCSALSSTRWHTFTHLMLMYRIMYCIQSRPKSPI